MAKTPIPNTSTKTERITVQSDTTLHATVSTTNSKVQSAPLNSLSIEQSDTTLSATVSTTNSKVQSAPLNLLSSTTLQSNGANALDASNASNTSNTDSLFDDIYDKIQDVLGGNDPNQFLCITMPGQVVSPEDFSYDYKNNAAKGPTIEMNESNLVNKLFDPCYHTGADNGFTLPYQYRSALDILSPKLNSKVAESKNKLRELLLTTYPYKFEGEESGTHTLQEVFYRLYDEYVQIEQQWTEKQNNELNRLEVLYPSNDADTNKKRNDAYLTWYETVAKSEISLVNEKYAKVLSVLSPNDMNILDGVLDCGSGAELEQARLTLQNTAKLTPSGGTVYPVKLNPTNWFEQLGTSFTPVDLLKTPEALSVQLKDLSSRRIAITSRISQISSIIPSDDALQALKDTVTTQEKVVAESQKDLVDKYGDGVSSIFSTVLDLTPMFVGGTVPTSIISKLTADFTPSTEKSADFKIDELINALGSSAIETNAAQVKFVDATQKLNDVMLKYAEANNMSELKTILSPLKEQLSQINAEISSLETEIKMSNAVGLGSSTSSSTNDVTPNQIPEGYTQIIIESDASTMNNQTSKASSSTSSTHGVSFLFGGCTTKNSKSTSSYESLTQTKDTKVRIGMNVAKIGIEREWFNPGVFSLTKDMFNVSNVKVSPSQSYTEITDERLKEMANGYLLPCYPVAMLIARDISVQISYGSKDSRDFANSIEQHASTGGGFLLFSGSKSSSSSNSNSGVHVQTNSDSITIKFTTPQILGYYQQTTPPDKSDILDNISQESAAVGYVTIGKFVEDYKKMILKMTPEANKYTNNQ